MTMKENMTEVEVKDGEREKEKEERKEGGKKVKDRGEKVMKMDE